MSLGVKIDTSAPASAASPDGSVTNPVGVNVVGGTVVAVQNPLPNGATGLTGSSGVVGSAGSAVATLTSAAGRTTYLTGFAIASLGATTQAVATVTITGLLGGTVNFGFAVPVGATLVANPVQMNFVPPLPASGANVNIVVTVAGQVGNTAVAAMATGYMV